MSFTTITDPELVGLGVTGLPDTPELSTEDMQAQFDEYPQFLKDKFKVHITEEEANTASSNIGATIPEELDNVTDEQIQPILNELATRVKNQKDWQDAADVNFSPTELNTAAFHADATDVTVPTVDTLDISDKAASTAFVDAKMQAIGAGDMAKSTYDPNNRGMVETAYKVENSYVNAITESTATYPVPEEGDKVKDIVGKQIKYAEDLKNDMLSTTDYGTCTTAASTAAKEITVSNDDWSLRTGSVICVLFSNTNTAQDPTFNVNNTGAKSVWYDTGVITDSNIGFAGTSGRPMLFMYNGTCWVFVGWSKDWKSNIDNLTATTAKKSDLTDISITGSTNNTGNTITSGTFFYLNGVIVKAKTNIADGATLTQDTNYEAVTAGALNDLKSSLTTLSDFSFTPLNSCDLSFLKIRKEANNMVHISGNITLGASCSKGGNINVGTFPSGITPDVARESFSTGYCYDKYATCLFYYTGGNLQLYKPSENLASGDLVVVNMHYKATS